MVLKMLKMHFLNVGHGDCCIVEFLDNDRTAIIDINRTTDMDELSAKEITEQLSYPSGYLETYAQETVLKAAGYNIALQDPIKYLNDNQIKQTVFRFISTHPHMDHLSGFDTLLDRGLWNAWIIENEFEPDLNKLTDSQKEDWDSYKTLRDNKDNKSGPLTIIRAKEGDSRNYWNQDNIKILAPNDELLEISKNQNSPNDMSYVLLVEHNGRKIILGGDAEEETWEYLVENYEDELTDIDILKASHHGRDSGYYQEAVKLMTPTYTIVSVGKKPSTDASNKYRQYSDNVFSTRWNGNVVFNIDDYGYISYEKQYDR